MKYLFIAWLSLIAAAGYGWVMNIVTLFGADFSIITGVLVLRVIGVFMAPLGAILGYF